MHHLATFWLAALAALAAVACLRPNQPPVAFFAISPPGGDAPLAAVFDATSSADPDGTVVRYAWDFGGGAGAAGAVVERVFGEPGSYVVKLAVTDDRGATRTVVQTLVVSERAPQMETLEQPAGRDEGAEGEPGAKLQ